MSEIPTEVLSEQLQHLLSQRRPLAAVFLTYCFEPAFFEKEVLSTLFDLSTIQGPPRLLRLEEELCKIEGKVAVYYDQNGLQKSDASAQLDFRRIPVRHPTGIFHPKLVLVLCEQEVAEEGEAPQRALLVGCMSANLTRAGWWENVEACHFEEIAEGDSTRMREALIKLLDRIRRGAAAGTDQSALEDVTRFLRRTDSKLQRSSQGSLHTHFYFSDGESVVDFLTRVVGSKLQGCYLEVVSPYMDNAARNVPLEQLLERFQPAETRVLLPRNQAGEAAVNERLYRNLAERDDVHWAHLPDKNLRLGPAADAGRRFVHAKVYRFFSLTPKMEIVFVGSVNLTVPAHRGTANMETGFLFEHSEVPRRPEFWLVPDERKPSAFEHANEERDVASQRGVPLVVRYSWRDAKAEAWWESREQSPELRLEASGVEIVSLAPLPPRQWVEFGAAEAARLQDTLTKSSFLTIVSHGQELGLILVQEEGMSHKPSLILTLSARDILQYWAMLTDEQKTQFLENRLGDAIGLGGDSELTVRRAIEDMPDTMFDRFAGIFHAFSCLQEAVTQQLEAGHWREAEYRLFGCKHDSLGRLLDKVLDETELDDDVHRYLVLLCARQVITEVAREHPEFWASHREDAKLLNTKLARVSEVKARMREADPDEMDKFLEWFEPWFISKARLPEQAT